MSKKNLIITGGIIIILIILLLVIKNKKIVPANNNIANDSAILDQITNNDSVEANTDVIEKQLDTVDISDIDITNDMKAIDSDLNTL